MYGLQNTMAAPQSTFFGNQGFGQGFGYQPLAASRAAASSASMPDLSSIFGGGAGIAVDAGDDTGAKPLSAANSFTLQLVQTMMGGFQSIMNSVMGGFASIFSGGKGVGSVLGGGIQALPGTEVAAGGTEESSGGFLSSLWGGVKEILPEVGGMLLDNIPYVGGFLKKGWNAIKGLF